MDLVRTLQMAADGADELKQVELKQRLVEARAEAIKLAEGMAELREERNALRERLDQQAMTFRENVYWREQEGQAPIGPGASLPHPGSRRRPVSCPRAAVRFATDGADRDREG